MNRGDQIYKTQVSVNRVEANEDVMGHKPITEDNGIPTYLILPKLVHQVSIQDLIANYPGLSREGVGPDLEYWVGFVHRTNRQEGRI